jgi:hypothetical protein
MTVKNRIGLLYILIRKKKKKHLKRKYNFPERKFGGVLLAIKTVNFSKLKFDVAFSRFRD